MKGERVRKKNRPGWRFRFKDPFTGRRMKRCFWYGEHLIAEQALHKVLGERQKLADDIPLSNGRRIEYKALVAKFLDEAPIATVERRDELKRLLERNLLNLKIVAELFDRGRLTSACRRLQEKGSTLCSFRALQAPLKQLLGLRALSY